jgi:hypothetical protein
MRRIDPVTLLLSSDNPRGAPAMPDSTVSSHYLLPRTVDDRIDGLQLDLDRGEIEPAAGYAALQALMAFRNKVVEVTGNRFAGATLVAEEHFAAHLREDLKAQYPAGFAALDAAVDWDKYARMCSVDYTVVSFGGRSYYVR